MPINEPTAAQRTSSASPCTGALVFLGLGLKVEKQEEAVRATRLRPRFRQWTSEVTGTSEKRARSRVSRERAPEPGPEPEPGPSMLSMSLTTLRISWRSDCRVVPRIFKMADTCFFLRGGAFTCQY